MDGSGPLLSLHARGRLIPPAPVPPNRDLTIPELWFCMRTNGLTAWPRRAYEQLLVHRRFLGVDAFVVNDPAEARRVMQNERYQRPASMRRIVRPGSGQGLVLAEGEAWRAARKRVAPVFTPAHVGALVAPLQAAARAFVDSLEGRPRVKLGPVLERAAIDAFGRAMLSMPMQAHAARISELTREYVRGVGRPQLADLLARNDEDFDWTQAGRRAWSRRWLAQIEAVLVDRGAIRRPAVQPDLVDLLEAARDPATGEPLRAELLRDEVAALTVTGFASTSRLLSWATYLLGRDRTEQRAIQAELDHAPPSEASTLADLAAWPRLRNAIHEALRLYPPAPSTIRVATEADEILGAAVRPGSLVVVSAWLMHRHRAWWRDPDAFIPERFAQAPERLRDGAFIPFGLGQRVCAGAAFAVTEATLILAELLSRFDLAIDDARPVMPVGNNTLYLSVEPWFRLTPRRPQ